MPARTRLAPILLALCTSMLAAGAAGAAEALEVKPGKWESRTESTSTMSPQPRVYTNTECVTADSWDPDTFMQDTDGCTFSNVVTSKSRMQWRVTCTTPAGQMSGDADYRSTGDTVNGTMRMDMEAGGMTITMDHRFEGRRLGDCD